MQPRRSLRLAAGALVLALPLLSSCGFDKATDRVYTPAAGVNDRDGEVDVLSGVIVAAQPNSGTFIASLSNNSSENDASLTEVAASGGSAGLTVSPIDSPIDVPARGFVNLLNEAPITVTGEFGAGDFEELTLTFESGDTVTMRVPVVYACDEWSGLDTSGESSASTSPQTEESESPSATSSTTAEPYDCGAVLEEE